MGFSATPLISSVVGQGSIGLDTKQDSLALVFSGLIDQDHLNPPAVEDFVELEGALIDLLLDT